jgi:predicted aspartyl protease
MIKNLKLCSLILLCLLQFAAQAQSIPASVMEQIRVGTNEISFKSDTLSVPLIDKIEKPVLEVFVNGKGPFKFLFDAGANVVTIAQWVTDEAKVRTLIKRTGKSVLLADSISVGGVRFKNVAAVNVKELDVDGVIGFNLFREELLTLDYPGQRLTWTKGSLPHADGKTIFNYELRERMPYIPVLIGKDSVWFNLDTGATSWIYLPETFKRTLALTGPVKAGDHSWNGDEGQFNSEKVKLSAPVWIGQFQIKNAMPNFSAHIEEPLLGSSFFKHFILRFDLTNKRVQLIKRSKNEIQMPD